MKIDGQIVTGAQTVLEACRAANAEVPAFCTVAGGSPGGHCRACLVEDRGRLIAACHTPAREDMDVQTDTPRLRAYRRDLGELMCSEVDVGALAPTLHAWGCDGSRYPRARERSPSADASHVYLRIDPSRCIACRSCLAACEQVQGQFVYAFRGRGATTALHWGDGAFADTDCVSCGACASVCPTGAVSDVDRERSSAGADPRVVQTTCGYCGVGCGLDVHVAGDRVQRVEGSAGHPVNRGHLCVKGRYAHGAARHPERLTTPLIRRAGRLEPATWDEAIALVGSTFARLHGQIAGLASSRCTNEESYLVQKWLRAGLGTHNVDCCARVCHAPTAAGMRRVFGTGAATNSFDDIEAADVLLVAGSNSTEAHPIVGARIKQAVLRGARLIVIDPRRTELASIADVHLQLHSGTNVPLLNAFACAMIQSGAIDRGFLAERADGFDAFADHVARYTPEATAAVSGVPAALVRRAAELYGRARRPLQTHGLGMTEHFQGSESVMLLCNLALLAGAVGRAGVGVNPLRGQNNVQGAADMGCQPDSVTGYQDPNAPSVRATFEHVWGRALPVAPGLMLPHMYEAAVAGRIKAMYILGEDVVQSDPAAHTGAALDALEFLVVQELFMTETAARAHVVLPGASFLEKDGTFTNAERRIQRVRKVLEPPAGARADWQVLCALMAASGLPQPFRDPSDIMDEIAQVAPLFAGVSHARLSGAGLQWPVPSSEHPGTRLLHERGFAAGRAPLACIEYVPSPVFAEAPAQAFPLRLITGRVLEHYNCGSMTRRSGNLALAPEDALELHAHDATAAGVRDAEVVEVISPFGRARARARISERVREGEAFLSFHFPATGTNRLTSAVLDRIAACPEYKVTPVRIEKV